VRTDHIVGPMPVRDGEVQAVTELDASKLASVERHGGPGTVGLGLVHGLGLARGAVASSIAHDNHNLLVAGVTDECLRRTELLYRQIVNTVVPVSSPKVAETAKIHENTFRAVNIALANELALMCDKLGISPWEVIEAAGTKPFAFLPHYPGPGLGGDCIPIVPHFLVWRLREYGYSPQLIEAAHEINARMPLYVVQKIADALNEVGRPIKGSRLLLLGVAYKADVHDTRESPSFEVMRQLLGRDGNVVYCDPWVPEFELDEQRWHSVEWSADEVEAADCVVVLTQHRQFLERPLWEHARLVVDTRNVVPAAANVTTI